MPPPALRAVVDRKGETFTFTFIFIFIFTVEHMYLKKKSNEYHENAQWHKIILKFSYYNSCHQCLLPYGYKLAKINSRNKSLFLHIVTYVKVICMYGCIHESEKSL